MRGLAVLIVGGALILVGVAAGSRAKTARAKASCVPLWRVVTEGAKVPNLVSVSARSATDVSALGSTGKEGGKSYRAVATHWDGHRLQVMRPLGSSPDFELSAVAAMARDDVWAVGDKSLERPVVVYWDARTWRLVPLPPLRSEAVLSDILAFSGTSPQPGVGVRTDAAEPREPQYLSKDRFQARPG